MSIRREVSMKMTDTEMVNATLDALAEAAEALKCLAVLRDEPRFSIVAQNIRGIREMALRALNRGKMAKMLDANGIRIN